MKRMILFCAFSVALSFSSSAQNVANTYWHAFSQNNVPDLFWHFTTNAVFYSSDYVNWTQVSTFTENTSTIYITDIPGPPPSCLGTGSYMKTFSVDTLRLNVISDTCSSRVSYMVSHYFVSMATDVHDVNVSVQLDLMPNPSAGIFHLVASAPVERVTIYDISGRTVTTQEVNAASTDIDLSNEPAGIYFAAIESLGQTSIVRLVRE